MFIGAFLLLFLISAATSQRSCDRTRMRQCEETLRRNIQRRISDRFDTSHCEDVLRDFNCLLKETRCLTTETERNENGNTLRNALIHLREGCDSNSGGRGSWRDSSCFIGDPMKNCESSYPLGGVQYSSHNPETCRKYNLFYDCAMTTVRDRCRPEDENMMGQYLMESAQDLAWNCGSSSTSDFDRNRDDRRYSNDRYSSSDRYGSDRINGDRTNGDRYSSDRFSNRERDGYSNNRDYGSNGDVQCCRNERCDRGRQQQCRDSLSRAIESRTSGYQDSQKCRRVRDDYNCLLWQTSNCVSRQDRDRENDIFRRARDFISRNCDTYGRWSDNSCYKTTEMQRCESLLSNTRGGANYESCRSYLSFRDCMQDELRSRCTREDDLYQGSYLGDKAQEMSWQCGSDSNGRGGTYNTFDRRDQYDRQDSGYDNGPIHLEDEDAMCLARIQTYTDQCKQTYEQKKRDQYLENDFYSRQKNTCCSVKELRSCIYDITRRYCQSERSRVVDSLMAGQKHLLVTDSCARIYDSECNSASQRHLSVILMITCIVMLFRGRYAREQF